MTCSRVKLTKVKVTLRVTVSQSWFRAPLGAQDQIIVKLTDYTAPTRGEGHGQGGGGREVEDPGSKAGNGPGDRAGKVPGA
jgi:hypothetical protein